MDMDKITESFQPDALRDAMGKARWWAAVAGMYLLLALLVVAISLLPKSDFGFFTFTGLLLVALPVAFAAGTALSAAEFKIEPEWLIGIVTNGRWVLMVGAGFLALELVSELLTLATGGKFWEPLTRWGLLLLVICVVAGVVLALVQPKPFNLLFDYTSVDPFAKSTWMAGLMFGTLLATGMYLMIVNGTSVTERTEDKQRMALEEARRHRRGIDVPTETEPAAR